MNLSMSPCQGWTMTSRCPPIPMTNLPKTRRWTNGPERNFLTDRCLTKNGQRMRRRSRPTLPAAYFLFLCCRKRDRHGEKQNQDSKKRIPSCLRRNPRCGKRNQGSKKRTLNCLRRNPHYGKRNQSLKKRTLNCLRKNLRCGKRNQSLRKRFPSFPKMSQNYCYRHCYRHCLRPLR